ncbi:MAG: 4Fe-4S binding protein [Alphaproteobacteria bacterium]|nr:4Fe-4S binding protein [Alphaproteobacteria bacterium]
MAVLVNALRRAAGACALLLSVLVLAWSSQAVAQARPPANTSNDLIFRIKPETVRELFPGEVTLTATEGRPPALEVREKGELKGYIFSTMDVVNATGYAGKPFDFFGGLTMDGKLTGVVLQQHSETIIGRGVPQARLDQFIAGFATATIQRWGRVDPDLIAGATISGRALKAGMQSAATRVYAAHIVGEVEQVVTEPQIDRKGFAPYNARELIEKGSIVGISVTVRDAIKLFEQKGGDGARPDISPQQMGRLDDLFIQFNMALVSPTSIGNNMFGDTRYRELMAREPNGELSIWMADKGYSSFVSNSHLRNATGNMFDQVRIEQGGTSFLFHRDEAVRMLVAAAFAGELLPSRESMVFAVPASAGLDPLKPFRVVLMQPGFTKAGAPMTVEIPITYDLPDVHKLLPVPVVRPAWIEIWESKVVDISILGALLAAVTLVFLFQDTLVRSRMAYNVVRIGLLSFTLGWLGWWVGAQFSIINILTYMTAPFTGAGLETLLLDPLFFVLGIYIAVTLFLLGRGVFCGWLCPFGALQELTNKLAILLRVPQIKVASGLQERLWAVKYILAIGILAIGFYSVDMANQLEEVEPFKTAINVYFVRELPFVLYAVALLAAGLFIERFYCRFLCPLGGALGVFGRLRMFKWLKRKPQCGTQCRICEADCPVGAIEPSGQINMNECLQCLDCQVDYYDDEKCPPLIARKKRKDARADAGMGVGAPAPAPAE